MLKQNLCFFKSFIKNYNKKSNEWNFSKHLKNKKVINNLNLFLYNKNNFLIKRYYVKNEDIKGETSKFFSLKKKFKK